MKEEAILKGVGALIRAGRITEFAEIFDHAKIYQVARGAGMKSDRMKRIMHTYGELTLLKYGISLRNHPAARE